MTPYASRLRDYVRTIGANSSVVAPAAGTVIVDSGAIPAGIYSVQVAGSYGGTPDVLDNMALWQGSVQVMSLPVIPLANQSPVFIPLPGMAISNGEHLTIRNIFAGGAGSVFRGTIIATPVSTLDVT